MRMYLEGNVRLSVYKANEIACLGYIFTTVFRTFSTAKMRTKQHATKAPHTGHN